MNIIIGNDHYVCIPDDSGIYNEFPLFLTKGGSLNTNYDEIREMKKNDPSFKNQDIIEEQDFKKLIDKLNDPDILKGENMIKYLASEEVVEKLK